MEHFDFAPQTRWVPGEDEFFNGFEPSEDDEIIPVPAGRLEAAQHELAKLNRKAEKLGFSGGAFNVVGQRVDTQMWFDTNDPTGRLRTNSLVLVTGSAPKLAGWEFVATLEPVGDDSEVLVRSVPGASVPAQYREADPFHCDHCGYIRQRNETFVVYNEETGEYKQVGRNCLKDFVGGNLSPARIAWLAGLPALIRGIAEEQRGHSFVEEYSTESILTLSAAAIRQHGWRSRTSARDSFATATADRIIDHLSVVRKYGTRENFVTRSDRRIPDENWIVTNEDDAELAHESRRWLLDEWADDGEYAHNLTLLLRQVAVTGKQIGFVASAIFAYQRETDCLEQRKADRRQAADSDWFGEIKERFDRSLTVDFTKLIDGHYGLSTLVKFHDEDGNIFSWFASGDRTRDFEKGATYRIRATVKAHAMYRDAKETQITRAAAL